MPSKRSTAASKGWATRRRKARERSERARRGWETRRRNKRSRAALKGWETKKNRQTERLKDIWVDPDGRYRDSKGKFVKRKDVLPAYRKSGKQYQRWDYERQRWMPSGKPAPGTAYEGPGGVRRDGQFIRRETVGAPKKLIDVRYESFLRNNIPEVFNEEVMGYRSWEFRSIRVHPFTRRRLDAISDSLRYRVTVEADPLTEVVGWIYFMSWDAAQDFVANLPEGLRASIHERGQADGITVLVFVPAHEIWPMVFEARGDVVKIKIQQIMTGREFNYLKITVRRLRRKTGKKRKK